MDRPVPIRAHFRAAATAQLAQHSLAAQMAATAGLRVLLLDCTGSAMRHDGLFNRLHVDAFYLDSPHEDVAPLLGAHDVVYVLTFHDEAGPHVPGAIRVTYGPAGLAWHHVAPAAAAP